MSSKKLNLITLLLTIFFTACGGGGGGEGQTDPAQTFELSFFKDATQGTKYATNISYSDNINISATGRYIIRIDAPAQYEGLMLSPMRELITLENDDFFLESQSTTIIDNTGYIHALQTENTFCTPATLDAFPAFVRVDDFGTLSDLYCENGEIIKTSWRTQSAGSNKIHFFITRSFGDVSETEARYTLDQNGSILSLLVKIQTATTQATIKSI